MAKLGFKPKEADELDFDLVEAFIVLQQEEYAFEWETRVKTLSKMFSGK